MYIDLHTQYPLFFSHLNETLISSAYFRKIIRFHENPSTWSRVGPCGRTDTHDEANSRCLQFCERAKKSCSASELRGLGLKKPSIRELTLILFWFRHCLFRLDKFAVWISNMQDVSEVVSVSSPPSFLLLCLATFITDSSLFASD